MAVDIGRINYEAYAKCVDDNQSWETLPRAEIDAWRYAAVAVLQQTDFEREQSEKGLIG